MAGHYSPNAPRFATPRAKLNGDWTGEGAALSSKYSLERLTAGAGWELYDFVYKCMEEELEKRPTLYHEFADSDVDAWTMKFLYYQPQDRLIETLRVEQDTPLNMKVVNILVKNQDDAKCERDLTGAVRQWLSDLFDKTEFGLTRLVLRKDMRTTPSIFVMVSKNMWALVDGPQGEASTTVPALRSVMCKQPMPWPPAEKFQQWRDGELRKRPILPKKPVVAMLEAALRRADGAVSLNMLTQAFAACYPPLIDSADIFVTTVDNFEYYARSSDTVEDEWAYLEQYPDSGDDYGFPYGGEE